MAWGSGIPNVVPRQDYLRALQGLALANQRNLQLSVLVQGLRDAVDQMTDNYNQAIQLGQQLRDLVEQQRTEIDGLRNTIRRYQQRYGLLPP